MARIAGGRESRPVRSGSQRHRRVASFRLRMRWDRKTVRTKCGVGESADGRSRIGLESAERDLRWRAVAPTGLAIPVQQLPALTGWANEFRRCAAVARLSVGFRSEQGVRDRDFRRAGTYLRKPRLVRLGCPAPARQKVQAQPAPNREPIVGFFCFSSERTVVRRQRMKPGCARLGRRGVSP